MDIPKLITIPVSSKQLLKASNIFPGGSLFPLLCFTASWVTSRGHSTF